MTNDPIYCTSKHPFLTNARENPPTVGQHVLALSIGGRLLETSWQKNSINFFVAWMPFPKMSGDIREELYAAYKGKRKI